MVAQNPTSDVELNRVLFEVVTRVLSVLGDNLLGAYLQGSFAVGDWDVYSDVDFLFVINQEVSDTELSALRLLHMQIKDIESNWSKHLEGSYFQKEVLRRKEDGGTELWYVDNGSRELVRSHHDNTHVVRWVVREYGITLYGPPPSTLIDPVSADDLRHEIMQIMHEWAQELFSAPEQMNDRWYQPFAVLSYCRMLHSLQTGRVGSKLAGATWGKNNLESRWEGLIQRAWDERPNPTLKAYQKADPDDFKSTLDFIRYALLIATKTGDSGQLQLKG